MGALELLSALNWCMAAIYGGAVLMTGVITEDLKTTLIVLTICSPFIAVHGYLGATIDKGKGRALQTVFAVAALAAIPIGTAFGIFALFACWFGDSAKSFEPPPPESRLPKRRRLLVPEENDRRR